MQVTGAEVLAALSGSPSSIGDVGTAVAVARGHERADPQQPAGPWLASVGLSLSAVQQVLDALVRAGSAVEVKGRELWDLGLPTAGTRAMGRYYLSG